MCVGGRGTGTDAVGDVTDVGKIGEMAMDTDDVLIGAVREAGLFSTIGVVV